MHSGRRRIRTNVEEERLQVVKLRLCKSQQPSRPVLLGTSGTLVLLEGISGDQNESGTSVDNSSGRVQDGGVVAVADALVDTPVFICGRG